MTQTTLREVTLETVANYRQVAEHAIDAYRAGGHRLLELMNRGVDRAARRGAERLAPRLAAALSRTGHKVTGVAAKSIDRISAQTGRMLDRGSRGVSRQVVHVADLVDGIENRYVVTGMQAAAQATLAGARAALKLSERLAAGADRLSGAIGRPAATRAKAGARRAAGKAAAGKARVETGAKPVARRARTAAAKAPAKAPVKAARARRMAPA